MGGTLDSHDRSKVYGALRVNFYPVGMGNDERQDSQQFLVINPGDFKLSPDRWRLQKTTFDFGSRIRYPNRGEEPKNHRGKNCFYRFFWGVSGFLLKHRL